MSLIMFSSIAFLSIWVGVEFGIIISTSNFSYPIKMTEKNLIFGDKKINESTFNINKEAIDINNDDINKIVIAKTESFGKKC